MPESNCQDSQIRPRISSGTGSRIICRTDPRSPACHPPFAISLVKPSLNTVENVSIDPFPFLQTVLPIFHLSSFSHPFAPLHFAFIFEN
jgi:hypothetical protein